jgi:hypothetical protein
MKIKKHINSSNLINGFTKLFAEHYEQCFISSKKVWKKTEIEHDKVNEQQGWHTPNTPSEMEKIYYSQWHNQCGGFFP